MRFSRDVTNARIVSRTARRIALRSAQAIEDRANGETNAAWVDETAPSIAVTRSSSAAVSGVREARGFAIQKRSTEPFAPVDRTTAISGVYFEPGAPVGDE
jgi:hypothetical protein